MASVGYKYPIILSGSSLLKQLSTGNMSQLLVNNFGYLHLLAHCPDHQRLFLLSSATPPQVHSLCEVCYNLLRGLIPLSEIQKRQLERHRDLIRNLADSSVPFKRKKQILSQKGSGFVEEIVSPLMSTLSLLLL